MVLDELDNVDKPTAVGYFILDTLRTMFQTGIKPSDPIRLSVALVTPEEFAAIEKRINVFTAPRPVEALGELYKLLVSVSSGEPEST